MWDIRLESWIPWRLANGNVAWGPIAQLGRATEPALEVVGTACPRPDFDGALHEFLIGLLSAALAPPDERAWRARWDEPPTPDALQAALDALPPAFDLDGDGPRFFQERSASDLADCDLAPIEQLLIDTPGDQGLRLNKDLFVKRGRAARVSRPVAAMALLTMQTYAPAGGAGHRTGLRGGGPLSTLVDPRFDAAGRPRAERQSLWARLWANVETVEQWSERTPAGAPDGPADRFPWLAPTRHSNAKSGGGPTSAARAHALQAYFGMPRRIRLEFGEDGRCDLTGRDDARLVVGFRMRNYGIQYTDWKHPLSPHRRAKPADAWLPVHPQPEGLGWRDWSALALRTHDAKGTREPAAAVVAFARRGRTLGLASARLHAFGYDMDNMKARGWLDAAMPALVATDERQEILSDTARRLADATGIAGSALLGGVRRALFRNPDASGGDLGAVRTELWDATEQAFYALMADVADPALEEQDALAVADRERRAFVDTLRDAALTVFDRWCPAGGLAPDVLRRRVVARHDLRSALTGYSPLGEKLFTALELPLPGGGRNARAATRRTRKETTA